MKLIHIATLFLLFVLIVSYGHRDDENKIVLYEMAESIDSLRLEVLQLQIDIVVLTGGVAFRSDQIDEANHLNEFLIRNINKRLDALTEKPTTKEKVKSECRGW